MTADDILDGLELAVIEYDPAAAAHWAQQAVAQQIDPITALAALTEAIREVGEGFGCGELFLPDLIAAAEAMAAATAILEAEVAQRGLHRQGLGVVVIGTVFGDIHDIGKNMVATLLSAAGFTVHDLGINVRAEAFVAAVTTYNAQVLALSALLTTTAPEQKKVIDLLTAANLRQQVKVIVGGGGITADFAAAIGADGFDATAPGAVKLTKTLLAL